ncbi:Defensin-2 [Camponotus floridanus]|nr:Defensin-2 [Camponotus floridanus]DAA35069.1 TPA_exp: defensin-2 [Camponotus floridanus]
MKIYVFTLLVVTAIAVAFPTEELELEENVTVESPDFLILKKDKSLQETPIKEHNRTRRATCDLLSGFGVNHSACAAHCILRGKTGGRCNSNAVCVCRA